MATKTLYAYAAIASPLTAALTNVLERQMVAWGETLDEAIAEMIVSALNANDVRGTHAVVLDRADVSVWRIADGPATPYVAAVESREHVAYAFLPDAQPATLEALVERLCPRPERE